MLQVLRLPRQSGKGSSVPNDRRPNIRTVRRRRFARGRAAYASGRATPRLYPRLGGKNAPPHQVGFSQILAARFFSLRNSLVCEGGGRIRMRMRGASQGGGRGFRPRRRPTFWFRISAGNCAATNARWTNGWKLCALLPKTICPPRLR